mgnify:CR=1 FL=1
MVDVVEESHADAAPLRGEQGCEDERSGLGLEAHVVQGEVEARASAVQKARDLRRDARRRLSAVGERQELDR